ncbi:MAG: alpha/beta hydrolase [Methanobacteriaceae archaeon]|nr:alpha/beta hydrolase [Methanobacteriaceae archaeon]MDP2835565.1 alpha/beta hydrolase [Methanobacteriaceae archaeon]MDP3484235.1 alpha/beta hydrolase [Methanobacteriaceae archaeon]MDP3623018.1 alpha/beta hydrolase [Methanobacteriaceae archaeon]
MDLYLKETGKNNPETIVFLHGGALGGWMWDKQLEAFKDYHCLVPDLPEHGKSSEVKPFTIKNAAEDILDLIRNQAHGGKAHVVGISLGAQIAVEMLSKSPELIDHVFISGTLVRRIPATDFLLKLLTYTIKAYIPIKNTDFLIKANIRSYNFPKEYFKNLKESTKSISSDSLNRILHENMLFKIPEGLEKANNPVLIIVGEKEYGIIKDSSKDMNEVLPNSQYFIAANMVHAWNLKEPEFFNSVLRAWITDKKLPEGLIYE